MKKGTLIKLKNKTYELFCKDSEWLIFAKRVVHRDNNGGGRSLKFNDIVVFSALPEFADEVKGLII